MELLKDKLKAYREEKGLTLQDMGNLLGVSHQMIRKYEAGSMPRPAVLSRFNEILGLNLNSSELRATRNYLVHGYNATPIDFFETDDIDFPNTRFKDLGNGKLMMLMPMVTEYARAGYLAGFSDPEYLESLPVHSTVVDRYHLGQYRAFVANGDSMNDGSIDSIPDQSVITGR